MLKKLSQIVQVVHIPLGIKLRFKGSHVIFFQSAKCSHKADHTTNGQLYRYIYSHCFSIGKKFAHPLKACRNKRQQDAKNE